MDALKMYFLLNMEIFDCYGKFPEGMLVKYYDLARWMDWQKKEKQEEG